MASQTTKSTSGLAIAGLVMGILAGVTSFLPIINNLSAIIAVIGGVLAVIALVGAVRGKNDSKGMAIAGVVLAVVSFAIVIATQSLYGAVIDSASKKLNEGSTPVESSKATSDDDASAKQESDAKKEETKQEDAKKEEPKQEEPATDYAHMSVGDTVTLDDGLSVTVNSIQLGADTTYDGTPLTATNVTLVNNGSSNVSFGMYDWKCEDANGVETSNYYFSSDKELLTSGKLKQGGTITGNVYFEGEPTRILYYSNMFQDDATVGWDVS